MPDPSAYERFRVLHAQPGAFVMPNAWDGASAVLLKRAGFAALGSSSAAIAFAMGRQDGAHAVSLADAVANARLLGQVSGLPVNGDLEDGFGPDPEHCVQTVEAAIAAGLGGLGIEDTTADPQHPIHAFDHAVARIRAAAQAARGRILLTGRTDNFLHGRADIDDTIRRLVAFAEVGADVLYAPGTARHGGDPRRGAGGRAEAGQCADRPALGRRAARRSRGGRRAARVARRGAVPACDAGAGGGGGGVARRRPRGRIARRADERNRGAAAVLTHAVWRPLS